MILYERKEERKKEREGEIRMSTFLFNRILLLVNVLEFNNTISTSKVVDKFRIILYTCIYTT